MTEYAMYKGDELLYIGTVDELAQKHGVKKHTIHYYKSPSYKKAVAKRKKCKELYIDCEVG